MKQSREVRLAWERCLDVRASHPGDSRVSTERVVSAPRDCCSTLPWARCSRPTEERPPARCRCECLSTWHPHDRVEEKWLL
eukprot:4052623-Prymnesium_polylepis.1